MSTEKKPDRLPLTDLIHASRAKEISLISESLREKKNVLITGQLVTGKTSLAKEILNLAEKGKIWEGQNIKTVYAWTEHILENDEFTQEDNESIKESKTAVVVMDEVGHLTNQIGDIDQKLLDLFLKQIKDLNAKGILVVAVGWTNPELISAISEIFPVVIDFQSPPETMAESDLINYRDANRTDENEPDE